MNTPTPVSRVILLALIACTFATSTILAQVPAEDRSNTLWYNSPARVWEEALPLGNGRLGAMVWGDIERERISLNEETIWAASKVGETTISSDYIHVNRRKQQLALEGRYDEIRKVTPANAPAPPGTEIVKKRVSGGSSGDIYNPLADLYLHFGSTDSVPIDYRRELNQRWTHKIGQPGSLSPNLKSNDPYVQKTSSAQS